MYIFLCVLEVLVAIALTITILLQSSKSAGLSGSIAGGAETFFGKKKGMDQKLSRLSSILGAVFLIIPIIIALV
ncbi:MAG: preprotein translocase subunit SecG [Bacillota bacterium]|jgi:preprotein translocase subunit SecG